MMKTRSTLLLAIVAQLICHFPNLAQADEWEACRTADPDESVSACTEIITAGNQSNANLAIAYYNRGNAHFRNGKYHLAINDYDSAISLDPSYAGAFGNRALAYKRVGDLNRAEGDFRRSLALSKTNSDREFAKSGLESIERSKAKETTVETVKEPTKTVNEPTNTVDETKTTINEAAAKKPDSAITDPKHNHTEPKSATLYNIDLGGALIEQQAANSVKTCEEFCIASPSCAAFSFNVWNNLCFLKETPTLAFLEPSIISGLKAGTPMPAKSNSKFEMNRYRGKAFPGDGYWSGKVNKFEECESRCQSASRCIAFSYKKNVFSCKLLERAPEYFRDQNFDSGVKRQVQTF